MDEVKLGFCRQFATDHGISNVEFKKGDITKIRLSSRYDLIVNIDVLEHIGPYRKVLKSFYSALKHSGYLYIHTPQINQQRIFKKFFSTWRHEEHVREGFDPKTLATELQSIGFRQIQHWPGFGLLVKFSWELNHISLSISLLLAALAFPIIYLISAIPNWDKKGLTIFFLVQKT